ncbi:tetraspanin-18-like [Carassius auratus]|uniref:Tetraspanin-18-like n=1 Tax=Carassius auratus TaxID=7957 RepID=A0A6P6JW75_CARAU|nr:tetraspanin-18-like [Carassius auratus]
MMKSSIHMCRCFLILSNILFAMVGFGLVYLGIRIWIHAALTGFYQISLKTSPFTIGLTVLIITGTLITLVGLLGNLGACSFKISALNLMSDELSEFYRELYTKDPLKRSYNETMILSVLHKTFDCCGIGEWIDYFKDTCPEDFLHEESEFPNCPIVIQDMFNSKAPLVLVGFLGIAGIMMLALVCSVIFSSYISNNPPSSGTNSELERLHNACIENLLNYLISFCK